MQIAFRAEESICQVEIGWTHDGVALGRHKTVSEQLGFNTFATGGLTMAYLQEQILRDSEQFIGEDR